jgi:hypothetical protein
MNQRAVYPSKYLASMIILSETFDVNGKLHSFHDKPARISLSIDNGKIIYEWCQHGDHGREGNKPVTVTKDNLLGIVKTWDAGGNLIDLLNIKTFESPRNYSLYNVPIAEENLKATLKHASKTRAPVWASWFLIMEAITQQQFDAFTEDGIWNTQLPFRWILFMWNPNEIFEVEKIKPLYPELHEDLRAITGISTNELLYYMEVSAVKYAENTPFSCPLSSLPSDESDTRSLSLMKKITSSFRNKRSNQKNSEERL